MQDSYDQLALRVKQYFDVEIHSFYQARHVTTCGRCFLPPLHPVHFPCPEPEPNKEEPTEGETSRPLKK